MTGRFWKARDCFTLSNNQTTKSKPIGSPGAFFQTIYFVEFSLAETLGTIIDYQLRHSFQRGKSSGMGQT